MPELTFNEGAVLDVVRAWSSRMRMPIPAHVVRSRANDQANVSYDGANRALNGLVAKGLLVKPVRGYYTLPALPGDTDG